MTHAIDPSHGGEPHAGHAHGDAGHQHAYGPPVYVLPEPNRFSRFVVRAYERTPRWVAPAAIAACFASAAGYVLISDPTSGGAADMPGCLVKLTTGLDCPGCGGTRAFYYLLRGNIPEAARYHAIAVFAAPFLVWLFVAWAIQHVSGRKIPAPRVNGRVLSFFLAAWAVFMLVRNIPFAPFTSLYI